MLQGHKSSLLIQYYSLVLQKHIRASSLVMRAQGRLLQMVTPKLRFKDVFRTEVESLATNILGRDDSVLV